MKYRNPDTGRFVSFADWKELQNMPEPSNDFDDWDDFEDFQEFGEDEYLGG